MTMTSGSMPAANVQNGELVEPAARALRRRLLSDEMIDGLLAEVDGGGLALTGQGGFLPELLKAVLERGLAVELDGHLGYEKGDAAGRGGPNSRNGSTPKTVATQVGDVALDTPRDRAGTFSPALVPKGTRRLGGLDETIISLYAGGMTVRDIEHHLARTVGTEISRETISKITDAVLDEVKAWQHRPLDPVYPVVFLDALVVKVRGDNVVTNKAAHIAVGVDTDGVKHVLGIWVQATEGAKFWAGVCAELANRGVKDILIACCDGLTGLPEAIEATWPGTVVQTCVVPSFEARGVRGPRLPSPLVELDDERLSAAGVTLLLKRDDLIHPDLPGNKYRKLRLDLDAATEQGRRRLLAFGGAYSNLIRAVAAAGELFGFETVGVIRGEEHLPLNPSLAYAVGRGMRLTYLDRTTYRRKHEPVVIEALHREFGDFYLIPEGGSNALAVRGCLDIPAEIEQDWDVLCCPVGTGGTLAGIAGGLKPGQRAIGSSALKGGDFLDAGVEELQRGTFGTRMGDWSIETAYHHRGFAKTTPELDAFLDDFAGRHGWRPDWIYVGKMLFGLFDLLGKGEFALGTTIVAVVTG